MSPLEHTKAAEAILKQLKPAGDGVLDDETEYDLRVAAVHAQLATAGAFAALTRTLQRVFEYDPVKAQEVARRRAHEAAQLVALGVESGEAES